MFGSVVIGVTAPVVTSIDASPPEVVPLLPEVELIPYSVFGSQLSDPAASADVAAEAWKPISTMSAAAPIAAARRRRDVRIDESVGMVNGRTRTPRAVTMGVDRPPATRRRQDVPAAR